MSQIYDSLKALISPEMISKASALVGEKDSKVSSAISSIIPGLLGGLLKKGDTPQVQNTLEDAGRSNILSDVGNIFSGNLSAEQQNIGNRFMQAVLGNKANEFNSDIASSAGISANSASKLTAMVSPVVAGFLGNKMCNNNLTLSGLLNDLQGEKSTFLNKVPANVESTLGFASTANNNNKTPGKKSYGWLTWLIIIALLLLLFFWWRSCRNTGTDKMVDRDRTTMVDTTRRTVMNENNNRNNNRESYTIDLDNGEKITVYRSGTDDEMVKFLKSDDYKNWDADKVSKKWFGFDDVRFKFDSATELMENDNNLMNNIASIMKSYPDTKVVIAGFADKKGGEEVNEDISKERADHIKSILVQKGVNANRISTKGYGEEFARHSENDSDRERSEDRTIALHFVK